MRPSRDDEDDGIAGLLFVFAIVVGLMGAASLRAAMAPHDFLP